VDGWDEGFRGMRAGAYDLAPPRQIVPEAAQNADINTNTTPEVLDLEQRKPGRN